MLFVLRYIMIKLIIFDLDGTLINAYPAVEDSVNYVMRYFGMPDQTRDALINSAKRGVRVRVFLEESGYNEKLNETNRRVANKLKQAGVQVIFDTLKKTTHNKMVVIDRRYSIVGSHNFTHAALKYNHELSLLIDDPILAATLVRYLETTIQP